MTIAKTRLHQFLLVLAFGFLLLLVLDSDLSQGKEMVVDANGNGDHTTIQDAINNAADGDTIYVWAGNYQETIIVNRTVTIIGNDSANTTIDGGGVGDVVNITADWVNMSGFAVKESGLTSWTDAGIEVRGDSCHISKVNSSGNQNGIILLEAEGTTIDNSTLNSNQEEGVIVDSSGRTVIEECMVKYNSDGVGIYEAGNVTVRRNNISSNDESGIWAWPGNGLVIVDNQIHDNTGDTDDAGIYLAESDENTVRNNTLTGNRIGIYLKGNLTTMEENAISGSLTRGIYLEDSGNNTISGNTVSGSGLSGIYLETSSNTTIEDNELAGNNRGVYLNDRANDNDITNNEVTDCGGDGIFINSYSGYNSVMENTVDSTGGRGIYMNRYCMYTRVENNSVDSSGSDGIYANFDSGHGVVANNTVSSSQYDGISVNARCSYTVIRDNQVNQSGYYGISLNAECEHSTIINNEVSNSGRDGINVNAYCHNLTISDNEVSFSDEGDGIYVNSNCRDSNITRNTVENNTYHGIRVAGNSGYTNITDNTVRYNGENGIYLRWNREHSSIRHNTVESNGLDGILLEETDTTTVENNDILAKGHIGISLVNSAGNTFESNTMTECGFFIQGELEDWNTQSIDTTNTVNDLPVRYYANSNGSTDAGDAGQVLVANSSYIKVENQTLNNCSVGVLIGYSNNITVANTSCSNSTYGIVVRSSDRTNITNSTITMNIVGVHVEGDGFALDLHGSRIQKNSEGGLACFFGGELDLTLVDNIIHDNNCSGSSLTPGGAVRVLGTSKKSSVARATLIGNTLTQELKGNGGLLRIGWANESIDLKEAYVTLRGNHLDPGDSTGGMVRLDAHDYVWVDARDNVFANTSDGGNFRVGNGAKDQIVILSDLDATIINNTFSYLNVKDGTGGLLRLAALNNVNAVLRNNSFGKTNNGGAVRIGFVASSRDEKAQNVTAEVHGNRFEFSDSGGQLRILSLDSVVARVENNTFNASATGGSLRIGFAGNGPKNYTQVVSAVVRNNTFTNISGGGVLRMASAVSINAVVEDNDFCEINNGGIVRIGRYGSSLDPTPADIDVIIRRNVFGESPTGSGLRLFARKNVTAIVEENVFKDCVDGGVMRIGWVGKSLEEISENVTATIKNNEFGALTDGGGSVRVLATNILKATITGNSFDNTTKGGALRVGWVGENVTETARVVEATVADNTFNTTNGGGILVKAKENLTADVHDNYLPGPADNKDRHLVELVSGGDISVEVYKNTLHNFTSGGIAVTGKGTNSAHIHDNNITLGDVGIYALDDHVTIENNTIRDMRDFGIYVENITSLTIQDTTITNATGGIYIGNTTEAYLENVNASFNQGTGIQVSSWFDIMMDCQGSHFDNNTEYGLLFDLTEGDTTIHFDAKDSSFNGNAWDGIHHNSHDLQNISYDVYLENVSADENAWYGTLLYPAQGGGYYDFVIRNSSFSRNEWSGLEIQPRRDAVVNLSVEGTDIVGNEWYGLTVVNRYTRGELDLSITDSNISYNEWTGVQIELARYGSAASPAAIWYNVELVDNHVIGNWWDGFNIMAGYDDGSITRDRRIEIRDNNMSSNLQYSIFHGEREDGTGDPANHYELIVEDNVLDYCGGNYIMMADIDTGRLVDNSMLDQDEDWDGVGMAIYSEHGIVLEEISGNLATSTGWAGLYLYSAEDMEVGEVTGNTMVEDVYGTGIFFEAKGGELHMDSFTDNVVDDNYEAGALFWAYGGFCAVTTISGNSANGTQVSDDWGAGIGLWSESHVGVSSITDNYMCDGGGMGFYVASDEGEVSVNRFSDNLVMNNTDNGFWATAPEGCSIEAWDNVISDNGENGTFIEAGEGTLEFMDNTITDNNNTGLYVEGCQFSYYGDNNCSDNGFAGILLTGCDRASVRDNTANDNGVRGISLSTSIGCLVRDNVAWRNKIGIHLQLDSTGNTIVWNEAGENEWFGIQLWDSSDNLISENELMENSDGITLESSSHYNNLTHNTVSDSHDDGVALTGSGYNTLKDNLIRFNQDDGIDLDDSHNNTIENNTLRANDEIGIRLFGSGNNSFRNNTVSDNGGGFYLADHSMNNTAHFNRITGNEEEHGINATANNGSAINATNNWWGSNLGPYHPANNTGGEGDNVTDYVLFDPWLHAPVITTVPGLFIDEDSLYEMEFEADDEDPGDEGSLAWYWDTNATWLEEMDGSFIIGGTPDNWDVGWYYVEVMVEDPLGLMDIVNYTLTVHNTNDLPNITTTSPDDLVAEDDEYSFTFTATDEDSIHGDEFSWYLNEGPTWLDMDEDTGELSGTPDNWDVDHHTVKVVVEDSAGKRDWFNFSLDVFNINDRPEIITTSPDDEVDEDAEYNFTFAASDDDDIHDDELTWFIEIGPVWLELDPDSGVLNGTPTNDDVGEHPVKVVVEDLDEATYFLEFTIEVINTNDPPEITITSPLENDELAGTVYVEGQYRDIDPNDELTLQVSIDGGDWEDIYIGRGSRASEWSSWSYEWKTAKYLNGDHVVFARVMDQKEIDFTHVEITTNNSYDGAYISLSLAVDEENQLLEIEGTVETLGDYLPESLTVKLELDPGARAVETVTATNGVFEIGMDIASLEGLEHVLRATATMPSGAVVTGEDSFELSDYQEATIELEITLDELITKTVSVTGSIDTGDDYLPEEVDVSLYLDPVTRAPDRTVTATDGAFETDLYIGDLGVGRHVLRVEAAMPHGVTLTTTTTFTLVNPAGIGELVHGNGTADSVSSEFPGERELDLGGLVRSGDVFEAKSHTVIKIYSNALEMGEGAEDIYLFLSEGTVAGFLLDGKSLLIGVQKGFAALYVEVNGESRSLTRAGEGIKEGVISILFDDSLMDEVFGDEGYDVVIDIDQVTSTTFFSLDVDESDTTITSYEGAVRVVNDEDEEVVDRFRTMDASPTGPLNARDAGYDRVDIEGDVTATFTVDGKDIEEVAGAYHIPFVGAADFSVAIIPEGNDYEIDIEEFRENDYTISTSRIRTMESRTFRVRTTALAEYGMSGEEEFSMNSDQTEETYDIEIIRTTDQGSSSFKGTDFQMIDKTQSFAVTDWDKLNDTGEKPVEYTVDGKTYKLATEITGQDVTTMIEEEDEEPEASPAALVFGLIIVVLVILVLSMRYWYPLLEGKPEAGGGEKADDKKPVEKTETEVEKIEEKKQEAPEKAEERPEDLLIIGEADPEGTENK